MWFFFFFKQKTAYEMRISDWSSDVCSSDLFDQAFAQRETDGIILEVGGGRHHHGIADAADLDRHRHFDRDLAQQVGIRDSAEADSAHRKRHGGAAFHHRPAVALITARPSLAKAPSSIASSSPRSARWSGSPQIAGDRPQIGRAQV